MENFDLNIIRKKLEDCLKKSIDFLSDKPMPRPYRGQEWIREKIRRTEEWTAKLEKCRAEIMNDLTESQADLFEKYVRDLIEEYKHRVNILTE